MKKIIILGAGLTGLSAAYHLKKDYAIYERENKVGGLCRSEKYEGFTFDYAIHILYTADPYALKLIKDLLGENLLIKERDSRIYSKGIFTRYPFQFNTYGLPYEVVQECLLGLIRARYERSDQKPPKNFEEWAVATFGEGIANHFLIPFNRKQWAIDLKKMGYDWIKDRVLQPDIEEVLEGALTDQKKKIGPNAVFFYPKEGGIESLPRAFLPHIAENGIYLKNEIKAISLKERTVFPERGSKQQYQYLISTFPLPKLVELIVDDSIPSEVRIASTLLQSNTVLAVNLGIKQNELSLMHWIYFPEDYFIFQRISFPMNFSKSMAPEGMSSITAEVSVSPDKKVNRENLIDRVIADLIKIGIVKDKKDVIFGNILVLSPAYVIYTQKRNEALALIKRYLRERNVYSCGRFGDWEYLNMDHSILRGKILAEEINAKE